MIIKTIIKAVSLFAMLSTASLAAEPVANSKENLAYNKPYKLSSVPVTTWYRSFKAKHQPYPDMNRALTDGITSKTLYFWVSNRCLNFSSAFPLEVTIDLGKIYPIEEIITHHGSSPAVGIAQPVKEEYFVSLDNINFIKVAEYINTFDPHPITETNKKRYFRGIKTFSSGSLKTKGRYVMVRTWGIAGNPENPALIRDGYVGHDEIIVKRGKFKLAEAQLNLKQAISVKLDYDDSLTGYPYHSRDWQQLFSRTPLAYLLVPNSFRGDKTYHLSVDGVYGINFAVINNALEQPTDITFKISFPKTVKLIDFNRFLPLVKQYKQKIAGKSYHTLVFKIPKPGYLKQPCFVITPKHSVISDNIGQLIYSWNYRQQGKIYSSEEHAFRLVVDAAIYAPVPKHFKTGFWVSGSSYKTLHDKYKTSKLIFKFYRQAGFNWINGGHSDKSIFKAATALKLDSSFEKDTCVNGFMVALYNRKLKNRLKKEIPFIYTNGKPGRYGVCPTKFLTGSYDRQLIAVIKTDLLTTRDIYVNWEPYMFQHKGCACEACKQAFQRFANLSTAQINSVWPKIIKAPNNKLYNQFVSQQLAGMMLKAQACTTIAGKELGRSYQPKFMPCMSPAYVNPTTDWYKIQQPAYWMKKLEKVSFFRYLNTINPFTMPQNKLNGNNLKLIPTLRNILAAQHKYGRKDLLTGRFLPKVYFLQTEYYFAKALVLPKDYYFTAVLTCLMGFDGYGTWGEGFKQDARYISQQARANRFISRYEDVIFNGKVINDFSISLKDQPQSTKNILFSTAFKYNNHIYIAVGNDSLSKHEVIIKTKRHHRNSMLWEQASGKHYRGNLATGIKLAIPGKSWLMLKLEGDFPIRGK